MRAIPASSVRVQTQHLYSFKETVVRASRSKSLPPPTKESRPYFLPRPHVAQPQTDSLSGLGSAPSASLSAPSMSSGELPLPSRVSARLPVSALRLRSRSTRASALRSPSGSRALLLASASAPFTPGCRTPSRASAPTPPPGAVQRVRSGPIRSPDARSRPTPSLARPRPPSLYGRRRRWTMPPPPPSALVSSRSSSLPYNCGISGLVPFPAGVPIAATECPPRAWHSLAATARKNLWWLGVARRFDFASIFAGETVSIEKTLASPFPPTIGFVW